MDLPDGARAPAGPVVEGGPADDRSRTSTAVPSPVEAQVAAVWADVLGMPDIGPEDDFFAVGGDSLAAMRILSRLTPGSDRQLSEADLEAARTVRGMAGVLGRAADRPDDPRPP